MGKLSDFKDTNNKPIGHFISSIKTESNPTIYFRNSMEMPQCLGKVVLSVEEIKNAKGNAVFLSVSQREKNLLQCRVLTIHYDN